MNDAIEINAMNNTKKIMKKTENKSINNYESNRKDYECNEEIS